MPARSVAQRVAGQVAEPDTAPARLALGQPSPRTLALAVAAAVVLAGGALALANRPGTDPVRTASPTSTSAAPGNPAPAGYTVEVTDVITDCAGHARGRTKNSFEDENCVKATRSLATGEVGGRQALFVASRIQMASPEAAAAVKQILDGSDTGNLNDLLRDGETFPEAPDEMPSSGYTSVQSGMVVTVAEAGFVDGDESSSTDPALRSAAAQVAALISAQG